MYNVLDVTTMVRANYTAKRRTRPINGFHSTMLLKGGTSLHLLPAGSEIRKAGDLWEVHMPLSNKRIVKQLAKHLDAVGYIV